MVVAPLIISLSIWLTFFNEAIIFDEREWRLMKANHPKMVVVVVIVMAVATVTDGL